MTNHRGVFHVLSGRRRVFVDTFSIRPTPLTQKGNMNAISIAGVQKHFGSTHAVRNLDLAVPQGSLCGFLGPNGAGKSTTIRMIMSIIYPDAGTIDVLGSSALANKDRIGYLPEERGVYRKMKVAEFVRYMAKLKGVDRPGFDRVIEEWLERVDLPDVAKKRCQELSKGMQQKVQFLAAVIHEPDLIILDEPFSGLDPVNATLINRLLRELHDSGRTIIFSTHVLAQAEAICDRIFLIHHGQKLLDDDLTSIRQRFDPRTVVAEPMNGHDAEQFASIARAAEGVIDVQSDPRTNEVEVALGEDVDPQPVMRELLAAGPTRGVRRRQLTLEEVFVRLVRQDAGDDAAVAAREAFADA